MIAVSIIIPVYNAETHLTECIESLISQSLENIELIFVNDGSSDKSEEIIRNFKNIDSRIKLVSQKNAGVSVARNNGIKEAKGEYIGFVDSDDYVANDMFQKMFDNANHGNLDVLVSGYNKVSQNNLIKIKSKFQLDIVFNSARIKKELIKEFVQTDNLNSCCNKIYKSEFIKNQTIEFPNGMTNGEDGFFNIDCFNNAKKIMFIDYCGYYYREVDGSATRNIMSKDYFNIAMERYQTDYITRFNLTLCPKDINVLKTKRFINTVVSIVHMYFDKDSKENFWLRYKYVKKISANALVQKILRENWALITENKNRYNQMILKSLKYKFVLGVALLVNYSSIKNKK